VRPRWVYVDGLYRPYAQASVHVEDRGLTFADAVYEVCAIRGGLVLDLDAHLDRLDRSLGELRIPPAMSRQSLTLVIGETIRRNGVRDGLVYLQASRGVAQRDHLFPVPAPRPGLFILARPVDTQALDARAALGAGIVTAADIRWGRRDIKSTGLLANVLAKQSAKDAGAADVWFHDAQMTVTEGASANAWIVDETGALRTRDLSSQILGGVTRRALLDRCAGLGLTAEERPFTVAEAKRAKEAFSTSAVALVVPVTRIDGVQIGDGRPGKVATALRQSYLENVALSAV
jgi:D-alanine transaminase